MSKECSRPDHSLKLIFTITDFNLKIFSDTVKTLIMFRETISPLFKDNSLLKDHIGPEVC